MKVALIFPGIAIDGFSSGGMRPKTGWIHHGLCFISSSLKNKGHEVSLIDLRQLSDWDELPAKIRSIRPDVAGITVMSLDRENAVKAAEIVKETDPGIRIIAGGAHPSIMPDDLSSFPHFDHIFAGEAEVTLPVVLESLALGKYPDKVIVGERPDLDIIPFTDRGLFKILEAPIVPYLKMPFVTAIAGRGCSYNCSFCQPAEKMIFGKTVRRMGVGRFIEELDRTRRTVGMNSLMIHDDCLLEDTRWVESFLKEYSAKRFPRSFVCQSRADIIVRNSGLFRDMRKCGLEMLLIGFESGSQRILNFIRKGTTVEQNIKAAEICGRLGVRVWANFMLGIPTETREEARDTVDMIKKIRPYVASPAFYTPHPGSDLFDYCVKNSLSLIKRSEDYKRSPEGMKIKGVDYGYLSNILSEVSTPGRIVKMKRKIDRLRLGRYNKELIERHAV